MNAPGRDLHPSRRVRCASAGSKGKSKPKPKASRKARARRSPAAAKPARAGSRPESALLAFEREVLPHRDELFGCALRYTRDRDAAEDLVQETMLRALGAWSSFIPGSNCRAWLFRILTNSFINNYRRRKRHRRFAQDSGDDAALALYGDDLDRNRNPHDELFCDALSDEVTSALASLTDEYRKVVELADLRGVRYREIAHELRVPIGTVMSRLFRARRQLEGQLSDYARSYGIARRAA